MTPLVPRTKQTLNGARMLRGTAACASLMLGLVALPDKASAASNCAGPGYLCVYDSNPQIPPGGRYGNFAGTNPSWAPYAWCKRADWFRNDGRTHNACVYEKTGYSGLRRTIPRGTVWTWPNFGCSNNWKRPGTGNC